MLTAVQVHDVDATADVTSSGDGGREALRIARRVITLLILSGVTFYTFWQLHPDLIFKNTTPTGGDMGAHVWGPAFLRDHILPSWTSGWSMDWYGGFPIYRYYMVVPAALMVLFNVVFPYGVAFKVVAVLGIVTLPLCSWAFGRLARFVWPVPELFALAALVFLFDEKFTIYGGNIASTMAGEFSFSIALSLAMLGFGLFSRVMQDGTYRGLAAAVIALAALSHGIVLFFVFGGAVMLLLVWADRDRLVQGGITLGVAALLSAFWVVPFVLGRQFMTDMKYEPKPSGSESWWELFFPHSTLTDRFWTALAIAGFLGAVLRRNRNGTFLGTFALVITAGVYIAREGIPVIGEGLLWNPRLLPFLHLLRYLLGFLGIVEITRLAIRGAEEIIAKKRSIRSAAPTPASEGVALQRGAGVETPAVETPAVETPGPELEGAPQRPSLAVRLAAAPRIPLLRGVALSSLAVIAALVTVGWTSFHLGELPGQRQVVRDGKWYFTWGPITASADNQGFVDGWASWNFSGYEGKPAYGEYYRIVERMKAIGQDPELGCGRAMWENNNDIEKYGTPMALMLLPFWTDGCIGSMEGLFFEAAGSTPYHFITAAAMSKQSSNPVRELRYDNNDASIGVPYLQALGVRYFMAFTPEAVAQAEAQPDLVQIAREDPWVVYEVRNSDLVVPLTVEPIVVNKRSGDQRERWLELGTSWLQHRSEWPALPAADGPDEWQRVRVDVDQERRIDDGRGSRRVDIVEAQDLFVTRELPAVQVSDVEMSQSSVSFSVDQPGVPVLVKVSYYPNWKVDGAEGPYRVAPNYMVVVPTSERVTLTYGKSGIDYLAMALTVLGVVAAFVIGRTSASYRFDTAALERREAADPFSFEAAARAQSRVGGGAVDTVVHPPALSAEPPATAGPPPPVSEMSSLPPFPSGAVPRGESSRGEPEPGRPSVTEGPGGARDTTSNGWDAVPLESFEVWNAGEAQPAEANAARSERPWPVDDLLPFDVDDRGEHDVVDPDDHHTPEHEGQTPEQEGRPSQNSSTSGEESITSRGDDEEGDSEPGDRTDR